MKTKKAIVVKGRKKWQDRGKCTYSFTCEDLVKVPFFLQFAVTKAAGMNPDFHSAVRFSSGLRCGRRLHQLQEYRNITAVGFHVVNSTVVSPSCNCPNFQPLACRIMGLRRLNWTLGGGNAASPTEEGVSARRFELSFMECDTVGQHHIVWPILPLGKRPDSLQKDVITVILTSFGFEQRAECSNH